jgi:hypothetical protein
VASSGARPTTTHPEVNAPMALADALTLNALPRPDTAPTANPQYLRQTLSSSRYQRSNQGKNRYQQHPTVVQTSNAEKISWQ